MKLTITVRNQRESKSESFTREIPHDPIFVRDEIMAYLDGVYGEYNEETSDKRGKGGK